MGGGACRLLLCVVRQCVYYSAKEVDRLDRERKLEFGFLCFFAYPPLIPPAGDGRESRGTRPSGAVCARPPAAQADKTAISSAHEYSLDERGGKNGNIDD